MWATCLGLEWLLQALGGAGFQLDAALDAWNISLPLEYTPEAQGVGVGVGVGGMHGGGGVDLIKKTDGTH